MSDPAARLRAAAELLRERAATATPGPWTEGFDLDPRQRALISPDYWTVATGMHKPDALWSQLMSPDKAHPLAAWLDDEARTFAEYAGRGITPNELALRVADALLTDPEGTNHD
jgi:hypothetical protein